MESTIDGIPISPEHIEFVKNEYEASRIALVPISRNTLAKHLAQKTGKPLKEALAVVDQYCEDNSVAIPDYLSKEFAVGWLKVLACFNTVFALGMFWYGRNLHLQHEQPAAVWVVAVIFLGLAVLSWIQSLEKEVENSRSDVDPIQRVQSLANEKERKAEAEKLRV